MTSQKNAENNYQLNMEILSSLKAIPGKIVNLQSENFINEELNKTLKYPEGKKTTSSSISKVSKDFFCDPLEEKINNKKLNTTNSVFKPIALFPQNPQKKSTMNYYHFNTLMSFPDLGLQNQAQNGPPKITNSSFSKNSFYMMNQNNVDPNMNLFNQINPQGNQMNTLTQINQINQINQFNFFNSNPFNSFNAINIINPTNLNFQNLNAQIPVNDIYLSKNNLSNYQNNNNNNINIDNNNNIFLSKKRNSEEKPKEKNKIKKNIFFKTNYPKLKKENLNINNINNTISQEITNKKNMFTVIAKSSYNYKKRKPRKKKFNNAFKKKLICGHQGCKGKFKTKKQLVFHHYKMNPQCQNDTISLLKMINDVKIMLKKIDKEKNQNKFGELYHETMKNVSLDEHIETLVGYNFEDEVD